jgi:RNA polymerase sigma factor (sigma-70 family)
MPDGIHPQTLDMLQSLKQKIVKMGDCGKSGICVDGEDLYQEVWLKVLRSPPLHALSPKLILVIARHIHIDMYMRNKRRLHLALEEVLDSPSTDGDPHHVLEEQERQAPVIEALNRLSPEDREMLQSGESNREVAVRKGVPVETVRTQRKRAMEKLLDAIVLDVVPNSRASRMTASSVPDVFPPSSVPRTRRFHQSSLEPQGVSPWPSHSISTP